MEQMANLNNRYVWTAEEVKLFLALIEEKKNYSYFRWKTTTQFHHISGPKRELVIKRIRQALECV